MHEVAGQLGLDSIAYLAKDATLVSARLASVLHLSHILDGKLGRLGAVEEGLAGDVRML